MNDQIYYIIRPASEFIRSTLMEVFTQKSAIKAVQLSNKTGDDLTDMQIYNDLHKILNCAI